MISQESKADEVLLRSYNGWEAKSQCVWQVMDISNSTKEEYRVSTVAEMLNKVLSDLKNVGHVEASAIVSRDGLLVASDVPPDIHAEAFAAMSAAMLGAAEKATSELKRENPNQIIVKFKGGEIIATGAGPEALLVVMANPGGLGLILVEVEKAAERVKELL
ncbi:MAG: roadblock/LC7 domain-containing protein [Methanocellales archaeon]|nr:roadblock/LC7 domain-containing protein [Methanocellales archaeon]